MVVDPSINQSTQISTTSMRIMMIGMGRSLAWEARRPNRSIESVELHPKATGRVCWIPRELSDSKWDLSVEEMAQIEQEWCSSRPLALPGEGLDKKRDRVRVGTSRGFRVFSFALVLLTEWR